MTNIGTLKLRMKVGESVFVGDSEIKLADISDTGGSATLVVFADKKMPVIRSKSLEKAYERNKGEN